MEHVVRIHKKDGVIESKVKAGSNLLKFLRKNSVDVNSPCGGSGTCGKCRVKVEGIQEEPSAKEKKLLGKNLEKGYRLACYNDINSDIDIYLEDSAKSSAKIAIEAKQRNIELEPIAAKKYIVLDTPNIDDQRPDLDRIGSGLKKLKIGNDIELLREIPEALRENDFKITLVSIDKKVISVEPGDTSGRIYGIAVDIGTTTVVGYLMDLVTGKRVDVYSMLNPQKKFGADVISRINYTMESANALKEMNKVISACINDIVRYFTKNNGIGRDEIYAITFVGNTTMMHFLMKLPSKNIAVSPFIPVTTQLHKIKALKIGVHINRHGYAIVFPAVSGYIGADTVAAVLSSGMYDSDKISLLVDIGTNGEIVLGNSKWMYSCSAAAGPAFEGAQIRNGVGGIKGAIDKVKVTPEFAYTTIGNERAIGICGSGIVDAVAGMLLSGVIDETGRILEEDEVAESLPDGFKKRLVDIDGLNSFLLVKGEECDAGVDIAVTQKDIRELQNAKAAIAAGIKILIKRAGIRTEDIDRVYLAGGFGSYIDIESALNIGLLPKELRGRVESIGNAAGAGAVEGLLSVGMLKESEKIKEKIKYIELSSCPDFMDEYVESMLFE